MAITVRMRRTISLRQVSGNHGQLFRPNQHNTSDINWYFHVEQRAGDCRSFVGWTQKLHVARLSIMKRVRSNHWKRRQSNESHLPEQKNVFSYCKCLDPRPQFFYRGESVLGHVAWAKRCHHWSHRKGLTGEAWKKTAQEIDKYCIIFFS